MKDLELHIVNSDDRDKEIKEIQKELKGEFEPKRIIQTNKGKLIKPSNTGYTWVQTLVQPFFPKFTQV